jgi:HAD superfamily hydrolase (TIGR01457 family)
MQLGDNKKYFILDMDGTFYLGDQILEGSLDFLKKVKGSGRNFLFFTNNSSKNQDVYVQKLARMGCTVDKSRVITSGMVTIHYLKKHWESPRVYLLGTPMLEEDFQNRGIQLTEDNPDAVVVGFDTTLTYEKLTKACTFIRNGVPFIATHPDNNCPMEDGPIPDCGAMCAFITKSTDVLPKYLGKPYEETMDYILDYLNASKDELVFVGDRLYTDIAIGARNGAASVLVLTGETKLKDLDGSDVKPDIIVDRLIDLAACF